MTPLLAQRPRQDRQFERLYRKHVGDVYRYSFAVLHNQADAEDVTQTTFLNAYRAFQNGERPDAPKNWLIAIAHNVCRQRFRQSARRPSEVAFVEEISPAVEEEDERYSVEEIKRALGQLQFNQRSALVMRELEGRSYAEIATILGLTVGAVETLIFRARRALREQLEGSLSCAEAELSLSRAADGVLPRAEKGALRAHLRECKSCATVARRQRAQRGALKALGAAPVPGPLIGWITSILGGGSAAAGSTVAVKAAAVTAAGLLVAGGGIEGKQLVQHRNVSVAPHAAQAAAPKAKPKPKPAAKSAARVSTASVPISSPAPFVAATTRVALPRLVDDRRGRSEDHSGKGNEGRGEDGGSASVVETERQDASGRDAAQLEDQRGKEDVAEKRSNSGKGKSAEVEHKAKRGDGEHTGKSAKGKSGDSEGRQPAAAPTTDHQGDGGGGDNGKAGEQSGGSGSSGHDPAAAEPDQSGKHGDSGGDGAVLPPVEQTVADLLPD